MENNTLQELKRSDDDDANIWDMMDGGNGLMFVEDDGKKTRNARNQHSGNSVRNYDD